MGGKKKPAQRSKGNTRPSSSGRCAEKLAKSGASVTGFIGFESLQGDASFVPAVQGSDEVDATVDGDFRLVMRKMTKRDVTTKIKAIQEFTVLCKERDAEAIKGTLPYWPRLFNKLSMDHDRRVREAVFKAQEQLVLKSRKNLAPYLRSIMGNWLLAQCDSYGPTATAATLAFDTAFPPLKQVEAITFCKQEILSLIEDNLFHQTAQTLSDPQITPQEEMEAKYNRIVMSSLLGLKLFLMKILKSEHENLQLSYEKILSEKKFWKYGRSDIPLIRSAWFQLVSTLCQVLPEAVCSHASSVCPVVLSSLDEVDPAISPVVWEAAMFVLVTVDDCWKHVNARKAVLPKLWAILQDGGRGNACAIFPNLLPFLSKVPSEVVGEGTQFYNEFFTKLRNGLSLKKVETSPTEYNAVVTAFMECLKYTLIQHADVSTSQQAENLMIDQLFPVLQASLTEANSTLPSTRLYPLLSDLVRYWYRSSTDPTSGQTFTNLTNIFWKELGVLERTILVNEKDNPLLPARIGSLIELFLCLQDPNRSPKRKSVEGNVRFEETELNDSALEGNKVDQPKVLDSMSLGSSEVSSLEASTEDFVKNAKELVEETDDFVSDEKNPLHVHVRELSQLAFHELKASKSIDHLSFVGNLIVTFPSEELFSSLLKFDNETTEETDDSAGDTCRMFFNQIVSPLVRLATDVKSRKNDWALGVVNLSTAAYDCATDEVRLEIMSALCKTCDPYILEHLIEMFTWKRARDKVFVTWLKSAELGHALVSLAQRLCTVSLDASEAATSSETEVIWQLLSFSLCTDGNLEPLVSSSYLSQILEAFHQALPKPGSVVTDSSHHLKTVVQFVCDLAARLFTNVRGCWQIPAAENLLITLFLITCQPLPCLPEKLLIKIEEAWKTGVTSLVEMKGGYINTGGFFQLVAVAIQQFVTSEVSSVEGLEHILNTTMSLIRHLHACLPIVSEPWTLTDNGTVLCFLEALLPSTEIRTQLRNQLGNQWLLKVIMEDELTTPELIECPKLPWKQSENIQHIFTSAFISQLLWQICQESKEMVAAEDEDGEETVENHCVSLAATSAHFEDLLYSHVFCKMVTGNGDGSSNKITKALESVRLMLDKSLPNLAQTLDKEAKLHLTKQLINASNAHGHLWSICFYEFVTLLGDSAVVGEWPLTAADVDAPRTDIGQLHTEQVVLRLRTTSVPTGIETLSTLSLAVADVDEADLLKLVHLIGLSAKELSNEYCIAAHTKDAVLMVMDFMVKCRELKNEWFLFACDLSESDWLVVSFNVEVQKFLCAVVKKYAEYLSGQHWDFILCGLCSWIQSCVESQSQLTKQISVLAFAKYSSMLVYCVANVIENARSLRNLAHHSLLTEWDEFFAEGVFSVLFPLVVTVAEEKAHSTASYHENSLLVSLARALEQIPTEHIVNSSLKPHVAANKGEASSIPLGIQTVLSRMCPLLTASIRPIQLCSFRILTKIFPLLGEYEEGERPVDEEESSRPLPFDLLTVLTESTAVVNSLFSEMMFGDVCFVQFSTDSYSYTLGYLLSWSLVMELFSAASSELRSQYASYLQSSGLMHDMLANVFHLIPENAAFPKDYLPSTAEEASSKSLGHRTLFSEKPDCDLAARNCTIELQHQACQVYFQAVKKLPALVRQWWNNQDKKSSALVDRITSKFVSPLLCALELQSVQHSDKKFENMTVKARPSAREVVAMYTIDEVSMELIIKLAPNHPLGPIGVECGKRVGVGNNQWRNWMLQLNTFLTYQNGSILDGLTLWKRNVDKKFEGIEECYICFYVLHGSNCQLPRVSCRTCKKKFHSACLYKWFSTSVQSTCPLCRNLF